ncbi:MAG: hypothetical protein ASARMPREDX12_005680 [Alectoria sarmentosa]|nr:MAG: hypothetical protein ASARMPREDX12_005680 [Alectoria sarmentosa]
MKSIIKLVMAAIIDLPYPVVVHQQTLSARLLELSFKYDALVTEINQHTSHTAAPYSKATVEQMVLVKKQTSDLAEAVGCPDEDEASHVCAALLIEEKGLAIQILTAELQWDRMEKEACNAKAEADVEKDVEGWKIVEEVEVEDSRLQ